MNNYDYIIIGAGASGLLLADAIGKDDFFSDKKVLLLDKDAKSFNDRTWCFWEKGKGQFESILNRTWNTIHFEGKQISKKTEIAPYNYKMIRGIDFYNHYLDKIKSYPNVEFRQEEVLDISETSASVTVKTAKGIFIGNYIFNSIFDYKMATQQKNYPVLQQHFIGWTIKAEQPAFEPNQVTYMDFSIPQKGNTRFMYVLPFSETTALIEYTLFSKDLLRKEEYEQEIRSYISSKFNVESYEILETEKGSIPMTCYDFREHHTDRVRYIGTAGGWAKPSTGYTLMSTSKKIPKLISLLKQGEPLKKLKLKNKFWYYDLLFLDVLYTDNEKGHQIFEDLFKARSPQMVFKFLDEETNIWEDFTYINSCPKAPFLKAFFRRLF
ncbi:MAG: lycopene cyclase family protein [Maribacter sp.]